MYNTPSFLEDHISQIPALQLLQNLGYIYLRPQEAFLERKGKLSNVLLEGVLTKQLKKLNKITFKGKQHEFSDSNIQAAVQVLKDIPYDGLVRTNEKVYDLICLGKSFEQTIEGDTKSFTIQYVDWKNPENNVFHVTEEFEVERTASRQTCRPDIVLFVNGIPFVVIECKRPDLKDPLEQSISQQIRNQKNDYIPKLFFYSQLLLGVTKNEASFATTGTARKFWSQWQERSDITSEVNRLINKALSKDLKDKLFADRFGYVRRYFDKLEVEERLPTEQDKAIYSLCRPERLLELTYQFIVFDAGEKKIARYQQYFAVKNIVGRIKRSDSTGKRTGGVVWHTQGSGKSLTMVMLAKALVLEPSIANPKVVLVTDRVDLDEQIWETFHHCGKEPEKAETGKHLLELLSKNRAAIITTVIDKFETAVKAQNYQDLSTNIFVLIDESHRSQYGTAHARMQKVLPNACYIGFTGTPLMKKEKNTAQRFGGIIDKYTIDQAVKDKAVVPLLYEGRHILQEVDQKAIDKWFDIVSKPLSDAQKTELKKKFASKTRLNKANHKIYLTAYDISEHFRNNWQGTGFKAQLVTDSKISALRFKEYLDEFELVSSEVLISGPDTRENNEDIYDADKDEVQEFWKKTMEKFGNEKNYNQKIINAFKRDSPPEIIIVVDKLLTGFDAPRNTVLYIARSLKEHTLLQAIARVNRLFEAKDFGYIIDYYGVLKDLGEAMDLYSSFSDFDQEDVANCLVDVINEVKTLPQKHSELWDIFKTIKNRMDEEAYETLLGDEEIREKFYGKLSAYNRTLGTAFSTVKFINETPEDLLDRYKNDLRFFQKLRMSVKKRYAEELDYKEYEAKVQKLINTHVSSNEVLQITPQVNIFEQDKFQAEIDKLQTKASRADTIAHRTKKTILEKMNEDPAFYTKFSIMLEKVIADYKEQRISDAEYLGEVTALMNSVVNRTGDNFPPELSSHDVAKAFYGVVNEILSKKDPPIENSREIAAKAALQIDTIVLKNKVVDWVLNIDIQNLMRNQIDDYLYELKGQWAINLTTDDMDSIIESSLSISKTRYA